MTEKFVSIALGLLSGIKSIPFGRELIAFMLSMSPILELRGGIIAGRALGLTPLYTLIICLIGNLIPVPFILILIKAIINKMRNSKIKLFKGIVSWTDKKVQKNKATIERYGFWGLVLFVGVPLPGTGAWTGCLVAAMLDIDKKKAFLATIVGVLMAGTIISLLSIGIFDFIL
ncbi:MAG: small multi-drug export protein [bacterium]|nr:small multi-drug export protein [bacterium]